MNESTKTAQIVREMTSYNLGILGIAECRWTGQGQTITKDGHLILYSGHESQHMYGVAIIIQKRHVKSLIQGVHRDADKSKLLFKVEKIIRY